MFVFKYENDSYGIPYLIATRFSPAGVNPFPVMAGLLTRPSRRAFPALHQWQVAATLRGLTAAGTVPDSHRIPFSSVAANRPEPFPITKIQIFFIIISFTRKKIRNLPESFRTILSEKGFMAKILIARGQATIYVQKDGYTITQSLGEYVFPADDTGKILSSVTLTSTVRVMCGDEELTAFTIGAVGKPAGFSSVTVNNGTKTLTYVITAGTTTLADHGTIDIPVTISGIVYHLSFVWSKAKAGIPGKDGVDADMLDWVKEWNTGKTLINGNTVITPKLFAGTKNSDGTVSGIAIGSFTLNTKTSSGTIAAEAVNGIYGFRDGYKTFYVDNGGNAQLGYGDQYVRYNATTGKVEFGSGVSLNWVGATYIDKDGVFTGTLSADTIQTISISASQTTSGIIAAARIDTAALKGWLRSLLVDGLLDGVVTVLTFIPVMGIMFLLLSILEDSGYMARAAFVMDRAMRALGLDGRAFLPIIVGFGCNLPALAATRTLSDSRQRVLTGMLVPFAACSARLSVFLVLAHAFFPKYAGLVVFLMYVASVMVILLVGVLLRHTMFRGLEPEPLMLALPAYQCPRALQLARSVLLRLWGFIRGASVIIISMITALWLLQGIPVTANAGGFAHVDDVHDSAYGVLADAVAPVFAPAGFDDWHASAALITGFVAKEVVVGSMSQSYHADEPDDAASQQAGEGTLGQKLRASFDQSSHGHGKAAAIAFLLFTLAYTPCLATVAEMRRQFGTKVAARSVLLSLAVAYVIAIIAFQTLRLIW